MKSKDAIWCVLFVAGLLLTAAPGIAEEQEQEAAVDWASLRGDERFEPLAWLVGEWQGYGLFANRRNLISKRYGYDLGGTVLVERTFDMFPTAEPTTDFEIHEDVSFVYRDTTSGELRAKSFYVEGFVSASTVAVDPDGRRFVFESTSIENAPPGMRVRYTIERQGENRWQGMFEIAMPGKQYSVVERLELVRAH